MSRLKQLVSEHSTTSSRLSKLWKTTIPPISNIPRLMEAPHQLAEFDPKLHYQSLADPAPPSDALQGKLGMPAAPGSMPVMMTPVQAHGTQGFAGGSVSITPENQEQTLDPPDSLAVLVKQEILLEDDDYLNTEGTEVKTEAPQQAFMRLADLAAKARELDPLNHDADLSSEEGIADFIVHTRERVSSMADTENTDAEIHVERGAEAAGTFVNGKAVEEVPDLPEFLPEALKPASAEPETADEPVPLETGNEPVLLKAGGEPGKLVETTEVRPLETAQSDDIVEATEESSNPVVAEDVSGTLEPEPEVASSVVELSTGANLLVNQVVLVNNWTVSPVIAVSGDNIHLNIISQTNVWSDHDRIDIEIEVETPFPPPVQPSNEPLDETSETTALNIASISTEATAPHEDTSSPNET